MKIKCSRDSLLSAFQMAATVAPSRTPKAVLRNVKMRIAPESSTLMATDMEVGMRIEFEGVEIEQPGEILLPVAQFGSILRESNDENLRIESDSAGTVIRGSRSVFHLGAENPAEFPDLAGFDEQSYHKLSGKLFRELIRRTIFATDNESTRYALGGILLEMINEEVVAVATDGRRLARMQGRGEAVGGHRTGEVMTIVPSRAMQLLERTLGDHETDVLLTVRANDILVKSGRAVVFSRLVDGRFPKWRDAFPNRPDSQKIALPVGPLLSAVRQAAIVSTSETRGVDFTFTEGNLTLASQTAEVGDSKIDLPISYDGPKMQLTLDHRFVSDFLRVLDADKTVVADIQERKAVIFSTDDGYGYVVMPMSRDT
jgi:DNA polymerase-3 subunit beta